MADFLRVIGPGNRGLLVFLALLLLVVGADRALAAPCTQIEGTREGFQVACDSVHASCENDPMTFECSSGSCTDEAGGAYPDCHRGYTDTGIVTFRVGFNGTCPENGSEGPPVYQDLGPGQTPDSQHCDFGCKLTNSGGCSRWGPFPDGTEASTCETQYTGARCIAGSGAPAPDEPPDEDTCATGAEINGQCVYLSNDDGFGDGANSEPVVCIGALCNEVPPHPNAQADCATNPTAAVCVGAQGGATPPRPPSPPYPPSQQPAHSMSGGPVGGERVNVDIYGPPGGNNAGPPDENGQCGHIPGAVVGETGCVCTSGNYFNGSACVDDGTGPDEGCPETDPNYPNCTGDETDRTAEFGSCGQAAPRCSGDEIDCSILKQTWATRCALIGTQPPPTIDLDDDPLQQYGGAEAFFDTVAGDDGSGPNGLDFGGFLGSDACPEAPALPVFRGQQLVMPQVWCDLSWFKSIIIGIALVIAFRIQFGED